MFDLGFPELMVIAIVAVLVVGPRELPRVLRTITGGMKKIRGLASEFQSSMEEMAREADLEDIRKDMKAVQSGDWKRELEDDIDPTGELQKSMKDFETDVKDAYKDPKNQAPSNSIKPPSDASADGNADGNADDEGEEGDAPRLNADGREVAEGSKVVPKVKKGGNATPSYGKAETASKSAAKKSTAQKTAAKKTAAKKSAAKKTASKTATSKTANSKTAGAKKSAAKTAANKTAAKKSAAKKSAAKKAAATKPADPDSGTKS